MNIIKEANGTTALAHDNGQYVLPGETLIDMQNGEHLTYVGIGQEGVLLTGYKQPTRQVTVLFEYVASRLVEPSNVSNPWARTHPCCPTR